jgi:UPF0755 protein
MRFSRLLIILVLLATTIALGRTYYLLKVWTYQGPTKIFEIDFGEGFASINHRLSSGGFISGPSLFHRYAKAKGLLLRIRPGAYEMKSGMNMSDVLKNFIKTPGIEITIPEGRNIFEVGKILEKAGVTSYEDFLRSARDTVLLSKYSITGGSAEGFLFPETYRFSPRTPARWVVNTMLEEFKKNTEGLAMSSSSLSPREVIIMASIVEKETGAEWERPIIAGVFLNRMKKNMRLQSDPTAIYAFFEKYQGNLSKEHLKLKGPYNTYRIKGLPPGPICGPGLAALKAVLAPKQHHYLYFVSKNDGVHEFTSTYEDHVKAVKKWQQNPSNRAGKSWRNLKK